MDRGPLPPGQTQAHVARPSGWDRIALVLQGGGALGAYQGGVYQALHEAGLEPDWIAGVSIGSISGAIIAGNPPERRVERLRQFWDCITARPTSVFVPDGDSPRRMANIWSSLLTMTLGQPGFFAPTVPNPWLSLRGSATATSFYDNAPLRQTLGELVDFDYLNSNGTRYACGAVNVRSGNFVYFDSIETIIELEHVMASGALPPAMPMMQVGTDWFWDGGLVSNTPLQHVFDNLGCVSTLIFQVDLFSARGPVPETLLEAAEREKDIRYSSRTRMNTDKNRQIHNARTAVRDLIAKLPEHLKDDPSVEYLRKAAKENTVTVVHLIYKSKNYETSSKDYDFSHVAMTEHWNAGVRDVYLSMRHKEWLERPQSGETMVTYDLTGETTETPAGKQE